MDARRATIGFFVDWLDDAYQQSVMKGILSRAQERDVNVLIFEGASIHSAKKSESNRNELYDGDVVDVCVALFEKKGYHFT